MRRQIYDKSKLDLYVQNTKHLLCMIKFHNLLSFLIQGYKNKTTRVYLGKSIIKLNVSGYIVIVY